MRAVSIDANPQHSHSLLLTKMVKTKATIKQVKLPPPNRQKVSKLQAQKSGGQSKKGVHGQKRPASDGSDDVESSEADLEGPRARQRKVRHVDTKESEEEVEENENEDEVEQVVDGDEDAESENVEQVSLL